jgi:hypothetical protein
LSRQFDIIIVLQRLCLNDVSSKVGIFGRRLLLAKLSTRAVLASRGMSSQILLSFVVRSILERFNTLTMCAGNLFLVAGGYFQF